MWSWDQQGGVEGTARHSSPLSLSRVCRVQRLKFPFQRKPGAWLLPVFSVLRQEDYQSGLHHGMLSLEKTKQGARGMSHWITWCPRMRPWVWIPSTHRKPSAVTCICNPGARPVGPADRGTSSFGERNLKVKVWSKKDTQCWLLTSTHSQSFA